MGIDSQKNDTLIIKEPAEIKYKDELQYLIDSDDSSKKPINWKLSPKQVIKFILGSDEPIDSSSSTKGKGKSKKTEISISKKFYGDPILIQRTVASLASNKALMLIGEPGTAKSFLSELLASAISGSSINTIQGSASVTEDQIKYSWNYALLLANGPSRQSLVPAPMLNGFEHGSIVRFEEITRCPPEIQDTILSLLSDKVMIIPELDDKGIIFAKNGFGLVATANTRDRGVNEMSSALKRRMNFETVKPLEDVELEMELVTNQVTEYLEKASIQREVVPDVIELLTTTFNELRSGKSVTGDKVERLAQVTMSTAECVETAINTAVYSHYIEDGPMSPFSAAISMRGTIIKDSLDDIAKLRNFFQIVVKNRSDKHWKEFYNAGLKIL